MTKKSLGDLKAGFIALAVGSIVMNDIMKAELISSYKEERIRIRMLRRRGLIVIEIRDKEYIETYHELETLKDLEEFVKKNNKWIIKQDQYNKIKTGKIILERVYRKYHKKEKIICEECGREHD